VTGLKLGLGYAFAPIPKWIVAEWCAGRMSPEAFNLHVVLYEKAISRKLMQRLPTPRMLRTELANYLRRPDDDAFKKLLYRERERGRLDYVVEGHAATGYVYVFTLYPDGPKLSDFGPTSDDAAGPTSDATGDEDVSGIAAHVGDDVSDHLAEQESASGPTNPPLGPTSNATATAPTEPDAEVTGDEPCPTSQDVREKANPRRGEDLLGRASGDDDLDVGEETESAGTNGRAQTDSGLTVPGSVVQSLPGMEPEKYPAPDERP
jgi:hypothetical protein